jgi:hypothetical protein
MVNNHREILNKSQEFKRLMNDNTTEGVARTLAFCIEFLALDRATGASARVVKATMPRIKTAVNDLFSYATQDEVLAICAAGEGSPGSQLIDGMQDGMRLSKDALSQRATNKQVTVPPTIAKFTTSDLQKEFVLCPKTRGRSTVYEKTNGPCTYTETLKDFDRLCPTEIKDSVCKKGHPIKIGKLDDGKTVIARKFSDDGRPTLEIQSNDGSGEKMKFRYGK